MGKIVAVGGGDMGNSETLPIDREIINLTGKAQPRALFIPTASYDSADYYEGFRKVYGRRLGCQTDVLLLLGINQPHEIVEEKILSSDLIYVGGGNTLKMMRRWRKLGVDHMLQTAYANGIVLAGVSAGAICWFSYGHSDSMAFYHPDDWGYVKVKGLGLIEALACPHYDGETDGIKREQDFQQMILKHSGLGMAIDNHCALEFNDNEFRVITSRPGAGAYKVYKSRGNVTVEPIEQITDFTPVSYLIRK